MTDSVRIRRARRPTEAQIINRPLKEWRQMRRRQGAPGDQFQRIMVFAKTLRDSPPALRALIRLLGLELQNVTMTQVLRQGHDPVVPSFFHHLFFDESMRLTRRGQTFDDLAPQITRRRSVNMLNDVLLPWPWSERRLADILQELSRRKCQWQSDHNHQIELVLPTRLCIVNGGNHSLTAGFALGKVGPLKSDAVRDLTRALRVVRSDGKVFWRTFDRKVIARVGLMEAAAIWEIARLMKDS